MGNVWTNENNKRDYENEYSPYSEDIGRFGRRKSKRWSLKKPRGYYKTVSELDVERGIPPELHYHSPNSIEEDLFSTDSRSPCVIQLHQRTRQDIYHRLRTAHPSSRAARPTSLDPRMLLDPNNTCDEPDAFSPQSPRNSSFVSSSIHINSRIRPGLETSLNSSDRKMKIDPSSGQGDIVKVDTSGAEFDRQANLRRSQRLSSCSVRQRANAAQRRQQRHKHKTLTVLPGNISSEIGDTPRRPYSVHSQTTTNSYPDSANESRSFSNGQVIVSPRQLRSVEIQTDDVKVIPVTPSQKRMRQKLYSNNSSPASSHGSTEYLVSPTAVPCPTVPMIKQTSTPINGVFDKELIRPSSLDVQNNDTSTDEGRHTGESNPPTPVRTGTPQELRASPQLKKSPTSPVATKNTSSGKDTHGNVGKPDGIAMRMNGGRLNQGEDRASSGCWSGTDSTQHSSSSDITTQHAPVMNALHQALKKERHSPNFANSAGQTSPIVDNRPLISSSAVSSSTTSLNSKLSTLGVGTSHSSLYRDDDERFLNASQSPSVISVTINRSNNSSTLSLNSIDGGQAISAAAIVKKARKSRLNGTGGAYSFMNYENDPLPNENDEVSRVVKSRRSTRSMKHRGHSKKRIGGEDTISLSSMADSSPRNTEIDAMSAHSGGKMTAETASLCESMFSVEHDGCGSLHGDGGVSRNTPPCALSMTSMHESVFPESKTPTGVPPVQVKSASPLTEEANSPIDGTYASYHRAVKSNHATPKSLLSPRSASVKVPKHVNPPALDFQSELNKRLSVRRVDDKKVKKGKRGAPPPPPKRASSLSTSSSPSPSPSTVSLSEKATGSKASTPSPKHVQSIEEYYRTTPPPTPLSNAQSKTPVMTSSTSNVSSPKTPSVTSSTNSTPSPSKKVMSPQDFYKNTPPPLPPMDQLPPPPPELLTPSEEEKPITSPVVKSEPSPVKVAVQSPTSPKSPNHGSISPMQSIAEQAALMGSRRSQKKKVTESVVETTVKKAENTTISPSPSSPKDVSNPTTSNNHPIKTSTPVSNSSPPYFAMKNHSQAPSPVSATPKPVKQSPSPLSSPASQPPKSIPPVTAPKPFKSPPPTSPKPATATKDGFKSKKSREQSPSYRASMARAAFFSTVPSPQPASSKPTKVPLISVNAEKTTTGTETEDSKKSPKIDVPEKAPVLETEKDEIEPSSPAQIESDSVKNASNIEEKENDKPLDTTVESQNESSESNTWMEELEGLSSSSPQPKEKLTPTNSISESAASKLGLSGNRNSAKYSNHDNLMVAIHKLKRENLNGKPVDASPPSSPGVNGESFSYRANGNKSPGSTLDKKRNGRLSSNGHRNAMSRKSSGGTSTDDFKALLLQNVRKGSSGSQMSAAEKLLLNKPSAAAALSRQRPNSVNDADRLGNADGIENIDEENEENSRPVLSLNDIRSAITSGSATTSRVGRTNRRGQRPNGGVEQKYATLSFHGKKHPPQSLSSKYNTRSRTPTRPMMSISEDSETEKSPEPKPIQSRIEENT